MEVNIGAWIILTFIVLVLLLLSIFYGKEFKSLLARFADDFEFEPEENVNDVYLKCSPKISKCLSNPPTQHSTCDSTDSDTKREMVKKEPTKLPLKDATEGSTINNNNNNNNNRRRRRRRRNRRRLHLKSALLKYLNHLTFDEAIARDKRSFLDLFIDILRSQFLSSKFSLDIASFKFLLLILNVGICCSLNGLLFNEEYISEKYKGNTNFVNLFVRTELPRVFCSAILTFILHLLIHFLFSFKKLFTLLILTKRKKVQGKPPEIFSKIKKRLIIYTVIVIILIIGLWYYVSAFCAVYLATQNIFLASSAFSVIFFLAFVVIFSLILALLRKTSIRIKSKTLFGCTSCLL